MPPTLLIPGNLIYPPGHEKDVPIKVILDWLKARSSEYNPNFNLSSMADRILIIKSTTGTGKSTTMPTEIFRLLRNRKSKVTDRYDGRSVMCTQPRIMNAISIATEQANAFYNPDLSFDVIGYQTSAFKSLPISGGLIYATVGTLSAQFSTWSDDKIISTYAFIIIDEVHEQSLGADMLLWSIKKFMQRCVKSRNKKAPFIICTSATLDVEKYASYFGVPTSTNTMSVEGLSFPVKEIYSEKNYDNVFIAAAEQSIEIHNNNDHPLRQEDNPKIDILIFVPGAAEAKIIKEYLEEYNTKLFNEKKDIYKIIIINRDEVQMKADEYYSALEWKLKDTITSFIIDGETINITPSRRIIIAGNVAETGITFPTLKYVIDTGWQRTKELYPPYHIEGLITKPAKQSNVKQRKGRVGRQFPGICYYMYTKETFDTMDVQEFPETIKSGINEIMLQIIDLMDKNISNIDLIDNPSNMAILEGLELGITLGYINENHELTELGKIAKKVSTMSLEHFRAICACYVFDVPIQKLIHMLAPVSLEKKPDIQKIKSNNYFYEMEKPIEEFLDKIINNDSDLKWVDEFIDKVITYKYNKKEQVLYNCLDSVNNYYDNIINAGLKIFTDKELNVDDKHVQHCLFDGLKKNLIKLNEDNKYINRHGIFVKLPKFEVPFGEAKYIITDSISIKSEQGEYFRYIPNANICAILNIPVDDDIYLSSP